ncbi:hypothetical protein [Paenibacillus terrigena]|uniref:hypothetical protein n=1 Tax=Paenibacillus terrigena TaxID=369333 RepID=UPI00036F32DD|nr:hypothetical protein [Paenibacillus terrigena]
MQRLLLLLPLLFLGMSSVVAQSELVTEKTNRIQKSVIEKELTLKGVLPTF